MISNRLLHLSGGRCTSVFILEELRSRRDPSQASPQPLARAEEVRMAARACPPQPPEPGPLGFGDGSCRAVRSQGHPRALPAGSKSSSSSWQGLRYALPTACVCSGPHLGSWAVTWELGKAPGHVPSGLSCSGGCREQHHALPASPRGAVNQVLLHQQTPSSRNYRR